MSPEPPKRPGHLRPVPAPGSAAESTARELEFEGEGTLGITAPQTRTHSGQFITDVIWPYLVGGLLPGLVASTLAYYLLRPIVGAYQTRRRARMVRRARRRPRIGRRHSGADAVD